MNNEMNDNTYFKAPNVPIVRVEAVDKKGNRYKLQQVDIKSEIDRAIVSERMKISMLYRNWKRRPKADETDFDDVISKLI